MPVTAISAATEIEAGSGFSCAVLAGGTARCWGHNMSGELGDGTTTGSSRPVPVKGISTATAITAGGQHSCALLSDGAVMCWGFNYSREAGIGESSTPLRAAGVRKAVAISAGGGRYRQYTCALLAGGTVRCWGDNSLGQLGDGTHRRSSSPVPVKGIHTATAISTGESHACAVLAGGTVKCWGSNKSGQLGTSRLRVSRTPVAVVRW